MKIILKHALIMKKLHKKILKIYFICDISIDERHEYIGKRVHGVQKIEIVVEIMGNIF